MKVLSVKVGNEDIAILDKESNKLQVYTGQRVVPVLKVSSIFNIIALRDLLNDAYPVEVYSTSNSVLGHKKRPRLQT